MRGSIYSIQSTPVVTSKSGDMCYGRVVAPNARISRSENSMTQNQLNWKTKEIKTKHWRVLVVNPSKTYNS